MHLQLGLPVYHRRSSCSASITLWHPAFGTVFLLGLSAHATSEIISLQCLQAASKNDVVIQFSELLKRERFAEVSKEFAALVKLLGSGHGFL